MNIKDGIYGLAVGDAYGVPFEFLSRDKIDISDEMVGFGTHMQPAGTWSDDTSLTLCVLDNLCVPIDYEKIMNAFVKWYRDGEYTVDGKYFDVGRGTRQAIGKYLCGYSPTKCGSRSIWNNGNGSLMRSLPLAYYFFYNNADVDRTVVKKMSSLTHGNSIAIMACNVYIEFGYRILNGEHKTEAYKNTIKENIRYWHQKDVYEIDDLKDISSIKYDDLSGSGYVVTTLQSALWTILHTESYKECIYKALKIGGDTDTIAAIAGGIAGIIYGRESIPAKWIYELRNKKLIDKICDKICLARSTSIL